MILLVHNVILIDSLIVIDSIFRSKKIESFFTSSIFVWKKCFELKFTLWNVKRHSTSREMDKS